MNKRGAEAGDMMLIFIFGFILFIIVGGIAIAFGLFYGQPLDYRTSDSSLLQTSVARCLTSNQLSKSFFDSFYQNCGLFKEVIMDKKFVIEISDGKTVYFSQGDAVQCQLQNKNIEYSRCTIGDVPANVGGKIVNLHIITGSNQQSSARTQT